MNSGPSDVDLPGRMPCQVDPPLSPAGSQQIWKAAVANASLDLRRIVSSPLRRARETASIMHQFLGQPGISEDLRLTEINMGGFSGKTLSEIRSSESLSDPWSHWEDGHVAHIAGAEPMLVGAMRASGVIDELLEMDGTSLVVGHGLLFRMLVSHAVLCAPVECGLRLVLDPGHFIVLDRVHSMDPSGCESALALTAVNVPIVPGFP